MSDSPYAPPQAVVKDIEPQGPPAERPWQARRGIQLMWITMAISVVSTFLALAPSVGEPGWWIGAVIIVVGNIFNALLYVAVGSGRNWARIVLVILIAIWALASIFPMFAQHAPTEPVYGNPLETTLLLVNVCIGVFACVLLLTGSSSAWFRAMKKARS